MPDVGNRQEEQCLTSWTKRTLIKQSSGTPTVIAKFLSSQIQINSWFDQHGTTNHMVNTTPKTILFLQEPIEHQRTTSQKASQLHMFELWISCVTRQDMRVLVGQIGITR